MKSPHDSEISVVKQPQVAQPTFSTHLDSAYRSVLNMAFFFLSAPTKPVFNVCAQNASPQDDTFVVNFSCLFSFYGSSPDFMGGLLLLQTRSFGQTPLANVFSVYPWEKSIQDHNFYIKHVGTHLFKQHRKTTVILKNPTHSAAF